VVIEVAKRNAAANNVEHRVHPVMQKKKGALLAHLIQAGKWQQVLVFTRTKHGANRLAKSLNTDGVNAAAIHGNKSQSARTAALKDFKAGKISVLVATDIASRGLDIDLLPFVVNYELPHVPEDYIHRIGRTGRAGASGVALSLVCHEEQSLLRGIERLLKHKIPMTEIPGFGPF
jgi:ATP-dependent RNA helicase RhlE